MKKIKFIARRILCFTGSLALLAFYSCKPLKPHEKIYVNDPEMRMDNDPSQQFGSYVQSIRTGSSIPSSGKGSGGCGCN